MRVSEREIVRDVLRRMADDSPEPVEFEELGGVLIRPGQAVRKSNTATGVLAIAVAMLLVTVGVFLDTTTEEPAASTNDVLLLPTVIPEDLTFGHASMWDALGQRLQDPGLANSIILEYQVADNDTSLDDVRTLTIEVRDRLSEVEARLAYETTHCVTDEGEEIDPDECRQLYENSECFGLGGIRENELDPDVCADEITQISGLDFTKTEVRNKPALITDVDDTNTAFVLVFEGGGVFSTVTGRFLDKAEVLQVAGSLEPATPGEYLQHIAAART